MNLREALQATVSQLAVSDEPMVESEHLLLAATGRQRKDLFSQPEATLDADQQHRLNRWIRRRQAGEPLAYILGERDFYGLTFKVSPDVLIPRADTETLVDWALELIPTDSTWRIADLGTGSGCIAISLADQRPHASLLATDQSVDALAIARENARRNDIRNIQFQQDDWLQSIQGPFDLIVSNPPYIDATSEYLQQGDLPAEPQSALTPGAEGLTAIREIISQAPAQLTKAGWLMLEHGFDQADAVAALLENAGFQGVQTRKDLTGNDRATGGHLG